MIDRWRSDRNQFNRSAPSKRQYRDLFVLAFLIAGRTGRLTNSWSEQAIFLAQRWTMTAHAPFMPSAPSFAVRWAFLPMKRASSMEPARSRPPFHSFDFLRPFATRKIFSVVWNQNNLHSCFINKEHRARNFYSLMPFCHCHAPAGCRKTKAIPESVDLTNSRHSTDHRIVRCCLLMLHEIPFTSYVSPFTILRLRQLELSQEPRPLRLPVSIDAVPCDAIHGRRQQIRIERLEEIG
jgi:hypothetical protein